MIFITVNVVDDDDCASDPCSNGAPCVDNTGYYACDCNKGYEGVNCELGNILYVTFVACASTLQAVDWLRSQVLFSSYHHLSYTHTHTHTHIYYQYTYTK